MGGFPWLSKLQISANQHIENICKRFIKLSQYCLQNYQAISHVHFVSIMILEHKIKKRPAWFSLENRKTQSVELCSILMERGKVLSLKW